MKLFLLFILSLIYQTIQLNGQQGFNKTFQYNNSSGVAFNNIISRDDTCVIYGSILVDSINQWGILFCKVDTSGQILDFRILADSFGGNWVVEPNNSIIQTTDGGYAMVGVVFERKSGFLLKLDKNGALLFYKEYKDNAVRTYYQNKIIEVADGFLIAGNKQKSDYSIDIFLLKTDTHGSKIWEKSYGVADTLENIGSLIQIDPNTFAIGASISTPAGTPLKDSYGRSYIFIVDTLGVLKSEWKSNKNEETGALGLNYLQDESSWTYVSRSFEVINPNDPTGWVSQGKIIKRSNNFNLILEREIGDPTSYLNFLSDLKVTPNKEWITVGQIIHTEDITNLYGVINKTTNEGDSLWIKYERPNIDSILGSENYLTGLTILPSGAAIVCGYTNKWEPIPESIGWLIKLNSDGCIEDLCDNLSLFSETQLSNIKIFPNPSHDQIMVEFDEIFNFALYDLSGHRIMDEKEQYGINYYDFSGIPTGTYLITIYNSTGVYSKKIIKI